MEHSIRNDTSFRHAAEMLWCLQKGDVLRDVPEHDTGLRDAERPEENDGLYCAECQALITHRRYRIVVNEQHEHVFANPAGHIFHIGCFGKAPGCRLVGEETDYFTWFPGYTWRYALCGQCINLLGWAFRSQDSVFFGLLVEKLCES